jgi:putative ABC transport system substrate-binding protein
VSLLVLSGGAAAWPLAARAQQPNKIPRIGVLWQGASAETHPYYKVLRDGFKAVGYAEGDLIFEDRFFDKNLEKMDLLAKELVDLKCDVLIGVTAPPALALRGQQAPFQLFLCTIQIRLDPALCRASITPVEMLQGLRTSVPMLPQSAWNCSGIPFPDCRAWH